MRGPFLPLVDVFGDPTMGELFSERAHIESWLEVERALAASQAEQGAIPAKAAAAIEQEATPDKVDLDVLRDSARLVGYPIVSLVAQVAARSPHEVGAYLHWGTTTQDIMDTGLVLMINRGLDRIEELEGGLTDAVATLAERHRAAPIAARTHAQQAVPTTFGAKLAVWIAELRRHRHRLGQVRARVATVSLFGAAGTAAALGPSSRAIRHQVAARLGLRPTDVPWHTSRDGLAELGFVLAALSATCGKIAREIIVLSMPEIGEVRERLAHNRGASSTMPQKSNPISSEVVVGLAVLAREQVSALLAAMQATHERSAGEWQIEWDAVPSLFALSAGCLVHAREAIEGLEVFPDRMRENMLADGGMIMAEAVMMVIAPRLGRLRAHEVVSDACRTARRDRRSLADVLPEVLDEKMLGDLDLPENLLSPESYLGEAEAIVDAATDSPTGS